MDILPAIDLRGGKVVRLQQGDYDKQTTYADDPSLVAQDFARAGTGWIHIVDLDAARIGQTANRAEILAIRRTVDVKIELGGGARSTDTIRRMLDDRVDRVVVGSAALKDWDWFEGLLGAETIPNDRLALGLDARDGRLAIHGWTEELPITAVDLAERVRDSGLAAIVYTDIARDGMLEGINIEATAEVLAATDVPVVASGGLSSLDDIRQCSQIGCGGVILGKALYEGRVDLGEAIAVADKQQ